MMTVFGNKFVLQCFNYALVIVTKHAKRVAYERLFDYVMQKRMQCIIRKTKLG